MPLIQVQKVHLSFHIFDCVAEQNGSTEGTLVPSYAAVFSVDDDGQVWQSQNK